MVNIYTLRIFTSKNRITRSEPSDGTSVTVAWRLLKYSFPVDTCDALDTYTSLNHAKGNSKIKTCYSDNYSSLKKAIKLLGVNWEPCQPGLHKNNAIIERCNQDIIYGVRVLLCQAGMPACYWPYAAPYYCHIENILTDENGQSAWQSRFGSDFNGDIFPFGCGVYFLPSAAQERNSKAAPSKLAM